MRIIIIGDGKLGFELSQRLSAENHDIIMIDNNQDALKISSDTQDVGCIYGNGIDASVLTEAGVSSADLVIAATAKDEVNILCCLVAKKLGASHTIARVRNPEISKSLNIIKEELGLSMVVNPEYAAATEISRIIRFSSAAKIDFFSKGRVEIVESKVIENSVLDNMTLSDLPNKLNSKIIICAVQRDKEVYIPNGSFVLKAGDQITITGAPTNISQFFRSIYGISTQKTKFVMIVGGGNISYYLARILADMNIKVKIIEINKKRAEELSDMLPKVMIINGDGSDREMLHEEGLDEVDALVALTGLDEENVVISMYALSRKIPKVITKINHITFGEILEKAGIECVITPHLITANHIVRYVRAMQNSLGSKVEALTKIANNQVEALEFSVKKDFNGIEIPLKDLKLKKGLLIACVTRGSNVIFPNGSDYIKADDSVIIITTDIGLDDLNDILEK